MKIFSENHNYSAQYFAKEAVRIGSEHGGEFDWQIAMDMMKIVLGYAPVAVYENLYADDN